MASPARLASWLVDNADSLNLQVKEVQWPKAFGLRNLWDYQVSIEVENQRFIGRGSAGSEELAFVKAGGEAIERAYCAGNGIHSIGIAAHIIDSAAKQKASEEWLERSAFFLHFNSKTPFALVSFAEITALLPEYVRAIEKVRARGIDIDFYSAKTGPGFSVLLCRASGLNASPRWGGIVGLGSSSSRKEAATSAVIEVLRNVSAVIDRGPLEPISDEEFRKIKDPKGWDRQRLAMSPLYWQKYDFLFPKEMANQNIAHDGSVILADQIQVEKLGCPFPILESAPIVIYRAIGANFMSESEERPHFLG